MIEIRLIHIVISCNLPGYLENLLNSFKDSGVNDDILVVDNGDVSSLVKIKLEDQFFKDRLNYFKNNQIGDSPKVGALYSAMNQAAEWAINKGYTHINLIQDDMQWIWYDDTEIKKAIKYLDSFNFSMIAIQFQKLILKDVFYKNNFFDSERMLWVSRNEGIADVGIISLEFLQKTKFKFGITESSGSSKLRSLGYKLAHISAPMLTFLPWPAVRREGLLIGQDLSKGEIGFFDILDKAAQEKIREKGLRGNFICADKYCKSTRAKILTPFWYTEPDFEYLGKVCKWALVNKKIPRFIGFNGAFFPSAEQIIFTVTPKIFKSKLFRLKKIFIYLRLKYDTDSRR